MTSPCTTSLALRRDGLARHFAFRPLALLGAAALALSLSSPANSQLRSEMRDPVRGVAFHSIELSNESVNSLDVISGSFGETDRLTVGLSAVVFDGTAAVDSWILWLRHEGRRWLDYDLIQPISASADGVSLTLEPLRGPQPFVGEGGRMYEKLEFLLSAEDFERLAASSRAVISLRSSNGDIDKHLTAADSERLRAFMGSILGRIAALRPVVNEGGNS